MRHEYLREGALLDSTHSRSEVIVLLASHAVTDVGGQGA